MIWTNHAFFWNRFKDLTTLLAYKQPDNLEQFLCQQIEARMKNGSRSIVYTEAEMQNIFTLYDLKGQNYITKDQCREGKLSLFFFVELLFVTASF